MFDLFIDPIYHAKRTFRNRGLTDKETSRKYQNIIGNIYAFHLSQKNFYRFGRNLISMTLTKQISHN